MKQWNYHCDFLENAHFCFRLLDLTCTLLWKTSAIDLHSQLRNWDIVLLKLSLALKNLSFDCIKESLYSRLT